MKNEASAIFWTYFPENASPFHHFNINLLIFNNYLRVKGALKRW
jgi:hypothetical protein